MNPKINEKNEYLEWLGHDLGQFAFLRWCGIRLGLDRLQGRIEYNDVLLLDLQAQFQ